MAIRRWIVVLAAFCAAVAPAVLLLGGSADASGVWATLPAMPAPRADLASAAYGGKLYLFGGYNTVEPSHVLTPYADTWAYNPATQTYDSLAPMPTARWGLAAASLDGFIYVMGGALDRAGTGARTVEQYDPATDTWASAPALPTALGNQGLTACADADYIYILYAGQLWKFDGTTYTRLANQSVAVLSWSTCAVTNGKLYQVGGYLNGAISYTQVYTIATNTWATKAAVPVPIYGAVRESPVIDGVLYLVNGQGAPGVFYADAWAYNIATNQWTHQPAGPYARDGVAGGVIDGAIYSFGGRADKVGPYGLTQAATFTPTPPPPPSPTPTVTPTPTPTGTCGP